jgi:PhnB protein
MTARLLEVAMSFHPYLFFSGNCREAFTRYHEIFGGELFLMPM